MTDVLMGTAKVLWDCLRQVRSLRFNAQSASTTSWNGSGTGQIVVETPSSNVIIFSETGMWIPQGSRETRFTNVFRWSLRGPATVRLEHLRFGPEQPVLLFDLIPLDQQHWLSATPHQCREDCYSAELQLQESGLILRWAITGPRKQESIEYQYGW